MGTLRKPALAVRAGKRPPSLGHSGLPPAAPDGIVMDRQWPDLGVSGRRHPVNGNAAIDDDILLDHVIVDDGRAIVESVDFNRRQPAMREIMLTEITQGDKGEQVGRQSEVEVQADADAVISEA